MAAVAAAIAAVAAMTVPEHPVPATMVAAAVAAVATAIAAVAVAVAAAIATVAVTVAAMAAMAGQGLILTADQGDPHDCEEDRNPKNQSTIHPFPPHKTGPGNPKHLLPSVFQSDPLGTATRTGDFSTNRSECPSF
jgi:hypothetical protein